MALVSTAESGAVQAVATTASVPRASAATDGAAERRRDEALDYVKGCLVLIMVVYHWLNYFVGPTWDYRYLRFLTPSFIFITGFLVGHVYLAKFTWDSPILRGRLVGRGLKLVLLFAALNLADSMLTVRGLSPDRLAGLWPAERMLAVLSGREAGQVFAILLPIGYFLILAPAVLVLAARTSLSASALALVGLAGAVGASFAGLENDFVNLLAIALVGLAVGVVGLRRLEGALDNPWIVVVLYGVYAIAITVLNTPFWLQVVGVCLSVLLLYVSAFAWGRPAIVKEEIVTLGRYSLFAYIAQIAVLQALRRAAPAGEATLVALVVTFMLAVALTVLSVRAIARLRARSETIASLYRLVFA